MSVDFDHLVHQSKDSVYRQMLRMCGNADQADDALADALLNAYRALDSLEDKHAFQAWLAQIARRACGRLKHKESAHPVLALGDLAFEPSLPATQEELAIEAETKTCVLEAFHSLEPVYADVYRLRELEGLSAEETATRLSLTIPAVKSRLHRARQLVRAKLDESFCSHEAS